MAISADTRAFFRNLLNPQGPYVTAESYVTPNDIAAISESFGIPLERLAIPSADAFLKLPETNPTWKTWAPYDTSSVYAEDEPKPDTPSEIQQIHHWIQALNHEAGPQLPLVFIRSAGLHRALRGDGPYQPFVVTEVRAQSLSWTPPFKPSSPLTLTPLVREENRWKLSRNIYPPRDDTEDYLTIPFQYGQEYAFPYTALMRSTHLRLILDTSVEDFTVQFPIIVDQASFAAAENSPAYNTLMGADLAMPKDIEFNEIYATPPEGEKHHPSHRTRNLTREAALRREITELTERVYDTQKSMVDLFTGLQRIYLRWGVMETPWWRTFERLTPQENQALELVFGQGWSTVDVAREMDVAEVKVIRYIRTGFQRFNNARGISWRR